MTASDIGHVVQVTAIYRDLSARAATTLTADTASGVAVPTATYQVEFSAATPVQTREGATVALEVQVAGGGTSTGTLTVRYRITDDSTDSSDYTDTPPGGVLTLSPGVSAGISIAIAEELLSEPDEQFTVTLLDNATSSLDTELVQLGTRTARQLTIAASDPITVALAGPPVIVEGSSAKYTVSLSGGQPTAPLQLNYSTADGTAVAGTDYTAHPATALSFTVTDATPRSITVRTINNAIIDAAPRNFLLRLTNPTGGGGPTPVLATSELPISIADDEGESAYAMLSVSPGDALAESAGTVNLMLTATLLGSPRSTPTSIQLVTEGTATAGTDYTAIPPLTLMIPANDSSAMVALSIELLDDNIVENPETIVITGTATGLTIQNILLLLNDDSDSATLSLTDTGPKDVLEGPAAEAEFTLSLTAPLADALTVAWSITPGTATAPEDYATATPPAIITAGETTATFSVAVRDTIPGESPETFTVTLGGATGPQADRVTVTPTSVLVTITEPPAPSGTGTIALEGEPLVGATLTATLTDPDVLDGNFTDLVWSWERVEAGGTVSEISGEDQATYRLTASDISHVVRVTATYREVPGGDEFMVTADTASGVAEPLDLTGDGNVDINDAAAFYYTYALPSALQNRDDRDDLASAILGPLATAAGISVDDLMLAVDTLRDNLAADLNQDGKVDERDAKVLYYALELGSRLDDESLLQEILRPLAHNPGSGTASELQDLQALLARVRARAQ